MTLYEVDIFYGSDEFSIKRRRMRLNANVRVEAARQALEKLTCEQADSLSRITIGDASIIDSHRAAMTPQKA